MSNYSDFRDKNTRFTGTAGERVTKGTTGERDTSYHSGGGVLRFNTTLQLLEYFDGVIWKSIDAPPEVLSISPTGWVSDGSTLETITVTGSNFSVGATVTFVGADNTEYNSASVTRNSITELTATTVASMGVANEPYSIKVVNSSGLASTLADALDAGAAPTFNVAAGTLGTLRAGNLAGSTLSRFANAEDADSTQLTFTVTTGTLPSGLSLGTGAAAGTVTGTAATVSTETTDTFTIEGTDGFNTNSRQYSITRAAPVVQAYTATGAFNYTIPAGVTGVNALLVAGGGGSSFIGGGAGAGGVVEAVGYDVSPYSGPGTVPGSLGAGGPRAPGSVHSNQGSWDGRGSDTTFGGLTAKGGGSSSGWIHQGTAGQTWNYSPGGSGGGGTGTNSGGLAIQPTQPGFSGNYGKGFPGAAGGNHPQSPETNNGQTGAGTHSGGGGGGASSAGGHPNQNGPGDTRTRQAAGRYGGYGYSSNYSGSAITYAGGGAGSSHNTGYNIGTIPGSPGGGGSAPPGGGQSGTTNRGGGAAGGHYPDTNGGIGGPGYVAIVS